MKCISQRLVAFAAIASTVCLMSIPLVNGQDSGAPIDDFNVDIQPAATEAQEYFDANNHGKEYLHDKHKKPRKPKPDRGVCPSPVHSTTLISLVCDSSTIDQIICTDRLPIIPAMIDETDVDALKNGDPKSKPTHMRQVVMSSPCPVELLSKCSAARTMTGELSDTEGDDLGDETGDDLEDDTGDDLEDDTGDGSGDKGDNDDTADTGDSEVDAQGDGQKHQHHRKNKNSYRDLCVATGTFCGNQLYGCDFDPHTLYTCNAVGEKPSVTETLAPVCTGDVKRRCCHGNGIVCGSSFHPDCKVSKSAIYSCSGVDADPKLLAKCRPGTRCQLRPSGAVCGFDNCNCTGTEEVCSELFPSSCGFTPNSRYKCSSTGQADLVETCNSSTCVTLSDSSVCTPKTCKCPGNGITCGAVFPLSCRIPTTSLYNCTAGSDPIEFMPCVRGTCSASAANLNTIRKDTCISDCICTGAGEVCGSTFPDHCTLDSDTLYKCAGRGTHTKCSGKCIIQAGNNTCRPPLECTCPTDTVTPICGYELPLSCNADPNTIYVCREGKGSEPEPLAVCKPGNTCIKKSLPEGAACGANNCECKGDNDVCSSAFPDSCGLEKNAIYTCTDGGKPELIKRCHAAQSCITAFDGCTCATNDCKCGVDGISCGEIFPLSCLLKRTALYTCKAGQPPLFRKDCSVGCSAMKSTVAAMDVFEALAADVCDKECTCMASGPVCGKTFPSKCNLEASTLYNCDGDDGAPKVVEVCGEGGCIVTNGDNHCNKDTSTCPGSGLSPVCGSELSASSGANANSIYHCPGGSGARPELLEICKPGTMCIKKSLPEGAACGANNCECKGDNDVCSSAFPDSCGLEKNAIYKCTDVGKPKLVKKCDATQSCVTVSDGSTCATNDCKCGEDGISCGEIFPLSCMLKKSALYTCKSGQPPLFKEDSPDGCSTKKAPIAAQTVFEALASDLSNSECTCLTAGLVCGQTFHPKCKFNSSTLYKCEGSGVKPTKSEACGEGGCLVTNGDDRCNENSCTCPGDGLHPVCGSDLPTSCKAEAQAIYKCKGGAGSTPEKLAICEPGTKCMKKDPPAGAICGFEGCKCKGDNEVCSDQFSDGCNLKKNSIYQCTASGNPKFVKKCDATKQCVKPDNEAICVSKDCLCTADGVSCGKIFPLSCELNQTSLYGCKKGATPKFKEDCAPNGCISIKSAVDKAAVVFLASAQDVCNDLCKCQEKGLICGDSFLERCGMKKGTLYKCNKVGDTPVVNNVCPNGKCTASGGDNSCESNKSGCTCPGEGESPVCGFELVDICKGEVDINPLAVYHCPKGKGSTPEIQKVCPQDTSCQKKPGPIGAECGVNCNCKAREDVCGKSFPKGCHLDDDTLYYCTKPDIEPYVGPKCNKGCMVLNDGNDKCSDGCGCPNNKVQCGKTLPHNCGFSNTDIYNCSAGAGTTPVLVKCAEGVCVGTPGDVHCSKIKNINIPPQCYCQNATTSMCGSSLDPQCTKALQVDEIDPKQIYTCTGGNGTLPQPGELCDDDSYCASQPESHGAICKPACACTGTSTKCSSDFDSDCKLPVGIYKCTEDGTVQEVQVCNGTEICAPSGKTFVCIPPECVCKDDLVHCGSFFPDSCKLEKETLYQCMNGKEAKLTKNCKPGSCSENIKPPAAMSIESDEGDFEEDASGDARCIQECYCKGAGPVCASTFDPSCGYQPNALMTCTAIGATPTVNESCTLECLATETPNKCKRSPCECAKVGDTCGQAYPANCSYEANTLYKCEVKGEMPVKGNPCASDQVCKAVAGGSDICGPVVLCDCRGTGKTCSDQYPPVCNFPKDTVINCPNLTQTHCSEGCVDGECMTDCKCSDDGLKCGSSFAVKCNYIPNSLYNCTKGGDPILDTPCGDLACTKSTLGDSCTDPCKCQNAYNTCSSAFPTNCNYKNDTLYACTGHGATPTELQSCVKGCLSTNPDMCRLDCASQVLSATNRIQAVLDELELLLITEVDPTANLPFKVGTNLTDVAIPPIVTLLTEMKASQTAAKDNPKSLALIAGQLSKTANGMALVFLRLAATFPDEKQGVMGPAIQELTALLPLLDNVIECSGSNESDCSGLVRLHNDFVEASLNYLQTPTVPPNTTPRTELIGQVKHVTTVIDDVFTSKNETALSEIGKQLNTAINDTSSDPNGYGDSNQVLRLIYLSASMALQCNGLNATVFGDKCSAYDDTAKALLSHVIRWLKQIVSLWGLASFITDPIMDAIDQAVHGVLTEASDTIAGAVGTIATLLDFLKIIAPVNYQWHILTFLKRLTGIRATQGDCGGKRDCYGAITFIMAILRVVPNLIDKLLFCHRDSAEGFGALNPLCIPGTLVNALFRGIGDLLGSASSSLSSGVGLALNTIYGFACKIVDVPGICPVLQYLKEAIQKIVTCLVDQNNNATLFHLVT